MKTITLASVCSIILLAIVPSLASASEIFHTGKAARPVQGYSSMMIEDLVQQKVEFRTKDNVAMSPNGVYGYEVVSTKPNKESRMTVYTIRISVGGSGYLIKMVGVYGRCEVKWISEKLIFVRSDWARHWGSDYIFDVESGRIIYEEGFSDRREQRQTSEQVVTPNGP